MRRSKRKAIQNTAVTISDLPNHITCDILSRLYLKSIFACKRVCKLWRDLTLEPYFAKLHLSRSPLSLISYCHGNDIDNSPSYFEILQLYDPLVLRRRDTTMKFRIDIYFPRIHMVASCNGSILLSNSSSADDLVIIVCNPLRAQQFILPKPPKLALRTHKVARLGFGHSPSTDQYKVLRFTSGTIHRPCRLNCEIFTIGIDDEWRSMGDTEQPPAFIISKINFLNGALYWIGLYWIGVENLQRFICYFDVEREYFQSFPLPSHIGKGFLYLEVVDNRLYLHNRDSLNVWRFWAMKDYGDFGSWTLEWVIEKPIVNKFNVRPLKMLKDGRLLMTFYEFRDAAKTIIASYNLRTRVLKKNKYHLSVRWSEAVADIPCFFSPMDALK